MNSFFRFRAGPNVPRGAFINTAAEACSIHESGRMVYNCLRDSQHYELDYFSLDAIDLDALKQGGVIRRMDGQECPQEYDFWVFNWHLWAMASRLALTEIERLRGLKFNILLELEPGNPLIYVPQDIFDGYLALDPLGQGEGKVFSFPRPLEGVGRVGKPAREVPVISSFGFGTPGKGFEMVVEAVNREFEEAIVRINIPAGAYTSGCDEFHNENYPRYLARIGNSIAKKGIDVRFSFDFMSPEELVDWCSESDLNCFLYTRRQPGLSATTDQAIMSGQPLITGTNDTFRHIHRYIPPYPLMTLKEAIAETPPMVRRLQQDWSKETFTRNFERMLRVFGLGSERPWQIFSQPKPATTDCGTLLIATTNTDEARPLLGYESRLADSLGRSGTRNVLIQPCLNEVDFNECVRLEGISSVVCLDMPEGSTFPQKFAERLGCPVVHMTDAFSGETLRNGVMLMGRRPIVPYFTCFCKAPKERLKIWLIGFGFDGSQLEPLLQKIGRETGNAEVYVDVCDDERHRIARRIENILKSDDCCNLTIEVRSVTDLKADEIVTAFGESSAVVVSAHPYRLALIEALCSLALTTERAVAFTRAAPLATFGGMGTYIEDMSIADLIRQGVIGQTGLVAEFGEWQTLARIERALARMNEKIIGRAPDRAGVAPQRVELNSLGARLSTLMGSTEVVPVSVIREALTLDGRDFVERAYRIILDREASGQDLDRQQEKLAREVSPAAVCGDLFFSSENVERLAKLGVSTGKLQSLQEIADPDFGQTAYAEIIGRPANPQEIEDIRRLAEGGLARAELLGSLLFSEEALELAEKREERARRMPLSIDGDPDAFVQAAYLRFLGRIADPGGLQHHLNAIDNGLSAIDLAAGVFLSDEGRRYQAGFGVDPSLWTCFKDADADELTVAAFRTVLDREPSQEEREHFEGRLLEQRISRSMLVGELLLSSEAIDRFAKLVTLKSVQGADTMSIDWSELANLAGRDFVNGIHWCTLGRCPDQPSLAERAERLLRGEDRASIAGELILSPEASAYLAQGWPYLAARLAALAQLDGADFVSEAYRLFAGQVPEAGFATATANLFGSSFDKYTLAGRLLLSARGLERMARRRLDDNSLTAALRTAHPFRLQSTGGKRAFFIFCQAGEDHHREISPAIASLSRALLDQDDALYFIRWSVELRKFVLLSRSQLRPLGQDRGVMHCVSLHPASNDQTSYLDDISLSADSWLLSPQTVRLNPDLDNLYEVEAITEARRLGLRSAFIFDGAEGLRRAGGDRARAEELYLQALLVADAIVPLSLIAENDLIGFFSQHMNAGAVPAIRRIEAPDDLSSEAFISGLRAFLKEIADPFIWLKSIYVCLPQTTSVNAIGMDLAKAFANRGVKVIPCAWDEVTNELRGRGDRKQPEQLAQEDALCWSEWVAPSDGNAPQWIVTLPGLRDRALRALADFAWHNDLRTAAILTEPEIDGSDSLLEALTGFDRVFATSTKAFGRLEEFLLGWRGRLTVAEDRFHLLPLPNEDLPGSRVFVLGDYVCQMTRKLLADQPAQQRHYLRRKPLREVYTSLPHLVPRPKLSICISTYQRADWVALNLRTLFEQLGPQRRDVEVIVIDNASTDHTGSVVEPYLARADFSYFCNPRNVGILGNLAVTVQRARGEYVWITGDDDLTRPGAITKILRVIDAHPRIPMIYVNYGYSSEKAPANITDVAHFLNNFNVLEPAGPDILAPTRDLAASSENFFTAIYAIVYRRDHAMQAYCQDTSGRTFSTLASCVPTAKYVLTYMMDEMAYWIGEQALVVNSNISWAAYGAMFDLEHLPRCWDLAERGGTDPEAVDRRRAARLWLTEMMWRDMYENDVAGNGAYLDPVKIINRIKHLPEFDDRVATFFDIYRRARENGHQAALLPAEKLFAAFQTEQQTRRDNNLQKERSA